MKKVLSIVALAAMTAGFVACGGSDAEKEAQRVADSTRVADSIAKATPVEPAPADTTASVDTTAAAQQ